MFLYFSTQLGFQRLLFKNTNWKKYSYSYCAGSFIHRRKKMRKKDKWMELRELYALFPVRNSKYLFIKEVKLSIYFYIF